MELYSIKKIGLSEARSGSCRILDGHLTGKMRTDANHPNRKKCFIFTENYLPDFSITYITAGLYGNRVFCIFCIFLQIYRKSMNPVKVPWDMTRFPEIEIVYPDENLISIIYHLPSVTHHLILTIYQQTSIIGGFTMINLQPSSSQSTDRLSEEQQDFILRKIAAFLPLSETAEKFRNEFPGSALTDQQLYNKIRYIGNDKKTDKWRTKIGEYREQLRKRPINSYAIGNQFDRIRILQRLIDIAIQPNLRRVLWYPVTKDPDGTVHYAKEEIWEPNYHAAMRGILLVHRELQMAG